MIAPQPVLASPRELRRLRQRVAELEALAAEMAGQFRPLTDSGRYYASQTVDAATVGRWNRVLAGER